MSPGTPLSGVFGVRGDGTVLIHTQDVVAWNVVAAIVGVFSHWRQ